MYVSYYFHHTKTSFYVGDGCSCFYNSTEYKLCYEGKTSHISQLRIDMLNEIGFPWAGEKRDQFWNDRYQELVAFHAKTGTSRVPEKYDEAPQLHTWVSLQRRQLKLRKEGKPTKLTDERVALLEQVGLECKIRNVATWMDRFVSMNYFGGEGRIILSISPIGTSHNLYCILQHSTDGVETLQG